MDYANLVNASGGFLVSMRPLNYQGPETYCDATGHCMTGKVILNTKPGFDSMTGLGSPGAKVHRHPREKLNPQLAGAARTVAPASRHHACLGSGSSIMHAQPTRP